MNEIPIPTLKALASQLNEIGTDWVFTGGSIIGLLLDEPSLSTTRPTDDVDVIIGIITQKSYSLIEEKLRSLDFDHDTTENAPMCRWVFRDSLIVDIMPSEGEFLGLNTEFFNEALASAETIAVHDVAIRVVNPINFIATKISAFKDRGKLDFFGSHDLEDIISVIDGRDGILEEIEQAADPIRNFIYSAFKDYSNCPDFLDSLAGHLPPDSASQQRLPSLLEKVRKIGE